MFCFLVVEVSFATDGRVRLFFGGFRRIRILKLFVEMVLVFFGVDAVNEGMRASKAAAST